MQPARRTAIACASLALVLSGLAAGMAAAPAASSVPVVRTGTARPAAPGAAFIGALAHQRYDAARTLLAPGVEFKALTPSLGFVDLHGRDAVMKLMREWYGPAEAAESIRSGRVVDRRWVDYRIRWSTPADGTQVFAQHAFYDLDPAGRIARIHLVCSGDRPVR